MTVSPLIRRQMLLAVLGLLGISALISVALLLDGSFSDTSVKILGSSFAVAIACLFGLAGSVILERMPALGLATIAGHATSAVLVLTFIATESHGHGAIRLVGAIFTLSTYGSLASILSSRERPGDTPAVQTAQAIGLLGFGALALGLFCASAGLVEFSLGGAKLAGVATVVGVLGVLAAPILRSASRDAAPAPQATDVDANGLEALVGLRVVALTGQARTILVFENGVHVSSR
jgi:hypothetical protein